MAELSKAYDEYCKLTALGGSERGTCICTRPKDCIMQDCDDFDRARDVAIARMFAMIPPHIRRLMGHEK